MENIGVVAQKSIKLFGLTITFNPEMIGMTYLVMGIIILLAWLATRKLSLIPGKGQSIVELLVSFFDDLVTSTLGPEGRKFTPYICTLFVFIFISNWIGVLPRVFHFLGMAGALMAKLFGADVEIQGGLFKWVVVVKEGTWYSFLGKIPEFKEPTRFIGTTLGMGIMVFFTVHIYAIRVKGVGRYLKSYIEPFPLMFPLNLAGELAKVMSHSFRLFGNILGGSIILLITSTLIHNLIWHALVKIRLLDLPVGGLLTVVAIPFQIGLGVFELFFFCLFIGLIQAFVFTMLALTYIAVQALE